MDAPKLTPRETDVVKLIAEGSTSAEAAAALGLSKHTVESYRKDIIKKLNLPNFFAVITWAYKTGVLTV